MKLGEEKCENCDWHEKHLGDCHRLSKGEFCEISVYGWRYMKKCDGCDDCVNFTKYTTAATEANIVRKTNVNGQNMKLQCL